MRILFFSKEGKLSTAFSLFKAVPLLLLIGTLIEACYPEFPPHCIKLILDIPFH